MLGMLFIPIILIAIIVAILLIAFSLYTVVPADYAHVVVQSGKTRVFSSDEKYSKGSKYSSDGKAAYFRIPSFIPGFGMNVHEMSLKILPINVPDFKAFDIDRARFLCDIMAYVAVTDPVEAAKRFAGEMKEVEEQVSKVVQATTRDSTTKKTVREIINDREGIIAEIKEPLSKAIANWGLALKDIELVEFKDADGTHVIADISSIIEEQINSEARQKNAEQKKLARLKEAIADEIAKKREIERDEEVSKREQQKSKLVAEKEKLALAEQLEVTKVDKVKNQEIEKEKARVLAEQERVVARIDAEKQKEVEAIIKEKKRLEGEGDRVRREEQAKGEAAPVREVGGAEADIILKKLQAEAKGKDDLQKALNQFGDAAIRALVAELIVEKDKEVGIAGAEALKYADLKVFAGGKDSESGFDLGQLVSSMIVSNPDTARAFLQRVGRPNDLGFVEGFAVGQYKPEDKRTPKETNKKEKPTKTKRDSIFKDAVKDIPNDIDVTINKEDSLKDIKEKVKNSKKRKRM